MIFPKFKALTYGLAAMLFLAFSFTACTPGEDNLKSIDEQSQLERGLVVPGAIMAEGETFVTAYLSEVDEATRVIYLNSFIVGKHLAELGKMEEALADLEVTANLSELNLVNYFNDVQLAKVQMEFINESSDAIERECIPVCYWNGTRWVFAGYYMC